MPQIIKKAIIISGFIFLFLLIVWADITGTYVKPVSPQKNLILSANKGTADCGPIACEYKFYLDNNSTADFSDLTIEAFFANKATNYKIFELVEKTIFENGTCLVCKEMDKNEACKDCCIDCLEYEQISRTITERVELATESAERETTVFDERIFERTLATDKLTLDKTETRTFLLEFEPLEKTGSFLIFSNADNNNSFASLDPDWDTAVFRHYKMNEASGNAIDSSANLVDALQLGTVPAQTGKINGSRGVYSAANRFSFSQAGAFTHSQDFTLCLWVYTVAVPNSYNGLLATPYIGTYTIRLERDTVNFSFTVGEYAWATKAIALDISTWYFVCATNQGTNHYGIVYVNGVAGTQKTFTTVPNSFGDFNMGTTQAGASDDLYIDDVRIYLKVLSATEMDFIYNAGAGTELESPPTDSCSCPASGWWNITGGDVCTLSASCTLTSGGLHIIDGNLTILNTKQLTIPSTYHAIIEKGEKLIIEKGGKLVVNK